MYCDSSDRVLGLKLPDNLIMGRIPDDLALLTDLQELQLMGNALTGPISSTLGRASLENLTIMQTLDLSSNQSNGTIPSALDRLTALQKLTKAVNQVSGTFRWSRADRETVVQSHFRWFQCKKHLY
jgi:Leucine-rich repeat (LRR) protein